MERSLRWLRDVRLRRGLLQYEILEKLVTYMPQGLAVNQWKLQKPFHFSKNYSFVWTMVDGAWLCFIPKSTLKLLSRAASSIALNNLLNKPCPLLCMGQKNFTILQHWHCCKHWVSFHSLSINTTNGCQLHKGSYCVFQPCLVWGTPLWLKETLLV